MPFSTILRTAANLFVLLMWIRFYGSVPLWYRNFLIGLSLIFAPALLLKGWKWSRLLFHQLSDEQKKDSTYCNGIFLSIIEGGLALFFMVFLFLLPRLFHLEQTGSPKDIIMLLCGEYIVISCFFETGLDCMLTREIHPPKWYFRSMPFSVFLTLCTLLGYYSGWLWTDCKKLAEFLQALFLLEIACNFTFRLVRKKEQTLL